jgi:integrase
MPTQKLTTKAVQNAKPPYAGRLVLWDSVVSDDTSLPGSFGLRVTITGVKSWVVMYRVEDERNPGSQKQRFMTLGHYPANTLAEAREKARDALKLAGKGEDPVEARGNVKRDIAAIETVEEAVSAFIVKYAKRQNRSWKEVERVFNSYVLPKWSNRKLPEITRKDIFELLEELMVADHPYMANRALAHIRKFFNWCLETGRVAVSPATNIKPPGKEVARDRVLNNDEINAVWKGADELGWPFGPAIKVLILTGQRRNEVLQMKWENLDLTKSLWTMPKEATKANRKHEVPLSKMVIELLESLPRNGIYVFSTNSRTPISGISKAKTRLDNFSNTSEWRIHDIRLTVASKMAELGIAPHVIEKVLNHSTGQISGVGAVYNRHTYLREKTDALNVWTRGLEATVLDSQSNVIEFEEAKK